MIDLTPHTFEIISAKEKIFLPISFADEIQWGVDKPQEGATKSKTFYQNSAPTGGYSPGDIWVDTDDSNHTYRAAEDMSWDSIRDAGAGSIQTTIFFQSTEPSSGMIVGDYWKDSDDNKLYRYADSSWSEVQDDGIATAIANALTAQNTADGKVFAFRQDTAPVDGDAPDPPGVLGEGDIWFDSNDDNKPYRYSAAGEGSWVAAEFDVADWAKIFGDNKPSNNADVTLDETNITDANIASINFNNITATNISATSINTGTLTGRVVRTSSGNTRVEMKVDDNTLSVYLNGNRRVVIGAGVVTFLTSSEVGSGDIYGLGSNQLGFNVSGSGDYAMSASAFYPLASGKDLGLSSTYRFDNLYLSGNIYVTGTVDGVNISAHKSRHYAGGSDAVIRTSQSSGSNLGISAGWAYTHDNNASAHHSKYTNANARAAIINYNLLGDLQLNAHDLETVKYLKFHSSYGKIYVGATEIINFYGTTKVECRKPFGFQVRSGTPGAASSFQGHMYYDTAQSDLVFSNGANWYKLTAQQI